MVSRVYTINGRSYRIDSSIRELQKTYDVRNEEIEKEYTLLKSIAPLYKVTKEHAIIGVVKRKMGK